MKSLSITLPDEAVKCLKDFASNRNVSINELMHELLTRTLPEEEAKQQSFLSPELLESRIRGLKLLKELDVLNLENQALDICKNQFESITPSSYNGYNNHTY